MNRGNSVRRQTSFASSRARSSGPGESKPARGDRVDAAANCGGARGASEPRTAAACPSSGGRRGHRTAARGGRAVDRTGCGGQQAGGAPRRGSGGRRRPVRCTPHPRDSRQGPRRAAVELRGARGLGPRSRAARRRRHADAGSSDPSRSALTTWGWTSSGDLHNDGPRAERGDRSGRAVGVLQRGPERLGALLHRRRIHPHDLPAVAVEVRPRGC
jgi:hypothetical protein